MVLWWKVEDSGDRLWWKGVVGWWWKERCGAEGRGYVLREGFVATSFVRGLDLVGGVRSWSGGGPEEILVGEKATGGRGGYLRRRGMTGGGACFVGGGAPRLFGGRWGDGFWEIPDVACSDFAKKFWTAARVVFLWQEPVRSSFVNRSHSVCGYYWNDGNFLHCLSQENEVSLKAQNSSVELRNLLRFLVHVKTFVFSVVPS